MGEYSWTRKRRVSYVLFPLLVAGVIVALLAGRSNSPATPTSAGVKIDTTGLPRPLAENIRHANEFVPESDNPLDDTLGKFEGFPIVVTQWASWCEVCHAEKPFFQGAAKKFKSTVAFVGIDMQDERDAAERFMDEIPLPFPSIFDPEAEYITALGGGRVSPTTVFIDAQGNNVHVREGGYPSQTALEADIERFTGAKPEA